MAQTVQILRTTTVNNPPAALLPGALSVELSTSWTKLWVGAGGGNRLLLSSNPVDTPLGTSAFLPLKGGTLTGALTLPADATLPLQAVPLQQVTAMLNTYLPLAGGSLSGPLTLSTPLAVTSGGTNATSAPGALTNLGAVAKAGDTMSGDLTLNASLSVNGAAGSYRVVYGRTAGVTRWAMALGDGSGETGSNAGSDFTLSRYSDAGAGIGNGLVINRATGNATFSGNYLHLAGDTGAVNAVGGPLIYTDTNTFIIKLPPGNSFAVQNNAGTSALLSVDASGNLSITGSTATKPGGGSWVAPSDVRLKTSVEPYERGLDAINKLQPITYKYNGEAGMPTDETFHGVIADDVKLVMPEAVGLGTFGAKPATEDDEAEPGTEYLTFDQTPILFALVNAVKELKAELDEIKAAMPSGLPNQLPATP